MATRSRQTRRARRAFSLVELVTVLAIVGVMAGIAVPRYARSIERYRADRTARRLVAELAWARHYARTASTPTTVRFDVAADTCALVGLADPDHTGQPYVVRVRDEPYRASIVSAKFDAGTGDPLEEVVFNEWGLPDSGGTVVIGAGTATSTIVLDADTGKADVP